MENNNATDFINKIKNDLNDAHNEAVMELAYMIIKKSITTGKVPHDTGALEASFIVNKTGEKEATIGSTVPYANRQYWEHKSLGKWFDRVVEENGEEFERRLKEYVKQFMK